MEEFKSIEDILNPDSRNLHFVMYDEVTSEQRLYELNDMHRSIDVITLSSEIPEKIISQFNVARNLALYSWFVYSFHPVAMMKVFSTVESALKIRLGQHKYGFKGLLKKSVKLGLLKDSGFNHIETPDDNNCIEYSKRIPDIVSKLRNDLAHGEVLLVPWGISNLRICADIINQLFENEINKND